MPPMQNKSKGRGRDARSGSRHTTPGSSISVPIASPSPTHTAFLEVPINAITLPAAVRYEDILERQATQGGMPDPPSLNALATELQTLADAAQRRSEINNSGMRELVKRRKIASEEERERDREREEKERREKRERSARRDAEKKEAERKDVELQDVTPEKKNGKAKRKDKATGSDDKAGERTPTSGLPAITKLEALEIPAIASPSRVGRTSKEPSIPPKDVGSGDSSSLSEASPVASPSVVQLTQTSAAPKDEESDDSSVDENPPPPLSATEPPPTFGSNPLIFDDPTIYEVRKVTDDMTDEEKKKIYCVSSFPHDDLRDLIAGTPPDKDFSNAVKPNNQVQAHTFASYLDGYLRPLKEDDLAFLRERGDSYTPFRIPPRGKKHYTEIWAEEDGLAAATSAERLDPNQPRGSIEQMDDATTETDRVSNGPVLNRLLSLMRFEHRTLPDDKAQVNGADGMNGEATNGVTEANDDAASGPPLPSATSIPEFGRPPNSGLTHAQIDEKLKAELRHIGFLPPDEEPDYDGHFDDEVAERLRLLQKRLREVKILNGARKARLLQLAEEEMAYQEFYSIQEDLDNQVQQAYLKRARTAGKSKKNVKRPGGPGGGSHFVNMGTSVSKPGIGDHAKQLMSRRKRWTEQIGPIFEEHRRRVPGPGESVFTPDVMEPLIKAEEARQEEEEAEM